MKNLPQISLGAVSLSPPVALAPMAGITDLPYRALVASFGAGLVVSEMVASVDIVNARPGTRERAELALGVEGSAVQLAGREAAPMAEAARMVEANGARLIDINMGCPAKKVTSGYSGSALMRDLDHALTLIDAVVRAVVPNFGETLTFAKQSIGGLRPREIPVTRSDGERRAARTR